MDWTVARALDPAADVATDPTRSGIVPPPPGVTPNFVDPYSRQHQLINASVIGLVLVLLVFAIRMWTRGFLMRSLGQDDCESSLIGLRQVASSN